MIAAVPSAALGLAVKVKVTVSGKAETEADGAKLHVTPAGMPVGHDSVTVPLNAAPPDTRNVIPWDAFPCCTETLAGEGAPMSTTCSVTAASCVVEPASVPTPFTLKK